MPQALHPMRIEKHFVTSSHVDVPALMLIGYMPGHVHHRLESVLDNLDRAGCRSWRDLQGDASSRVSGTRQLPTIHTPAPGPALIGMKVSVCLSHLSGGLHS